MARSPPAQTYGYATIPSNYYYDEAEEFVGDFSENEAVSEGAPRLLAPPNVTEIYRRKSAAASTHDRFRQQAMYIPSEYYYDTMAQPVPSQMRRPAAYRRHIPMVDERARFYSAAALENGYRDAAVFSSPHIATAVRRPTTAHPAGAPVQRHVVRRHPVTVRTPRYYRRAAVSNVYKKPSALCLPLACQPDPAVYRRNRKQPEENTFHPRQISQAEAIPKCQSVPVASASAENRQQTSTTPEYPDMHISKSDVDAVLARYETILGDHNVDLPGHEVGSYSSKSSKQSKLSKSKLISHMHPKIPSSIRQRQLQKGSNTSSKAGSEKPQSKAKQRDLAVEEITTEVLDSMLSELMETGCANKINQAIGDKARDVENASRRTDYSEGSTKLQPSSACHKNTLNQYPKSFNYQDITQNMSKPDESSRSTSAATTPRYQRRSNSVSSSISPPKPPMRVCSVEDNNAMELHRSKSYIVSLIDRALSKELGTMPNNKLPQSPVAPPQPPPPPPPVPPSAQLGHGDHMNARQAIDLMNKNMEKMDKGLCLEISQALTDSFVSNATAPPAPSPQVPEINHSSTCTCNVQDEPVYVKQLKQLRWGHLRHIQREVRRLEDLERFLDSCSSGSFT